jgi:hypothetical protein
MEKDLLVDAIWEDMEEWRTCDNGGFNAWACPSGCHTVSFDSEEKKEEVEVVDATEVDLH